MIIEKILLRNFRNYDEMTLLPHEGVNLFFGPNGSGKTNLLEAVHYCALGKSHRISGDQNTVRFGETFGLCELTVRSASSCRKISVQLVPGDSNKKSILIDGKKIKRFSDMMGCLQCVIFSPEDMGLIREGPSFRRRYLDMMISQINRGYFIALQQYRSALEQKNAILKLLRTGGHVEYAILDAFEHTMAQPAATIISERKKVVDRIRSRAAEIYRNISGNDQELFSVEYHSSLNDTDDIAAEFCRQSMENRDMDMRYGICSVGPHRDDLLLNLSGKNMKIFASQGQVRTGALSMKLAQLKILSEIGGDQPVLLLDDVMSELDKTRRMKLISEINPYQTFITCTDETDLELELNKRTYAVSSRDGICHIEETGSGELIPRPEFREPDFT